MQEKGEKPTVDPTAQAAETTSRRALFGVIIAAIITAAATISATVINKSCGNASGPFPPPPPQPCQFAITQVNDINVSQFIVPAVLPVGTIKGSLSGACAPDWQVSVYIRHKGSDTNWSRIGSAQPDHGQWLIPNAVFHLPLDADPIEMRVLLRVVTARMLPPPEAADQDLAGFDQAAHAMSHQMELNVLMPRVTLERVNSISLSPGMFVASAGSLQGSAQGPFPLGAKLFAYVRRRGGLPTAWERAGSVALSNRQRDWQLADVPFRMPLSNGETETDIQLVVAQGTDPAKTLSDNELINLARHAAVTPAQSVVKVRKLVVSITRVELSNKGTFIVSGEVSNLLVGEEKLCVRLVRHVGDQLQPTRCGYPSLSSHPWSIDLGISGRNFAEVEVGLVSGIYEGDSAPSGFEPLHRHPLGRR